MRSLLSYLSMIALLLAVPALAQGPAQGPAQGLPNAPAATTTTIHAGPPTTATAPKNVYAGGVSYNTNAHPAIAGTALYAHNLDPKQSLSTYAITVFDAVPTSYSPLTVTTNVGVGVAQDVYKIRSATVWMPTSAGISWTGKNTGWAWTGGVAVSIPITKQRFYLIPNVRFLRSNVSNNSGYQVIAGFLFGIGN